MLGDNPTLLPTVFVCSLDYSTVLIIFYSFCFNKVPSKAFRMVWMIVDMILCKIVTFVSSTKNPIIYWNVILVWNFYTWFIYKFPIFSYFFEFLELQKYGHYSDHYRMFYFWQILFSMLCLLVLWFLWLKLVNINCGNDKL